MTIRLPAWVVDNRIAVAREAEPYRGLSPEERLVALAKACRAAGRQLAQRRDRQRLLDYRDPVPESTRVAMARLRRECRQKP